MSAKRRVAEPIRFRGTPASLTGVLAESAGGAFDMKVSIPRAKAKREPIEAAVQADADPRILRLTLPLEVGPGTYDGVLVIDGQERPARIEVDAAPLLRVIPEQLRIEAHPGDVVGADLTLLNLGNVAVTLRDMQAIGVFMAGGVERALRRAYVHTLAKGERRVDVIAEGLAEAHGGLVKMKLQKGSGEVGPGELRALEVVLHLPRDLAAGAVYAGNWELAGLVYPITIVVAGEQAEPGGEDGEDRPVVKKRRARVKKRRARG